MGKTTAGDRLKQVANHLKPAEAVPSVKAHGARFRPTLPDGLPVSYTPLNPVTFLLKAALIKPHHLAVVHPEKGLSWNYLDWSALPATPKSRGPSS